MYEILKEEYDRLEQTSDMKAQEYREYTDRGGHVSRPVEEYVSRKESLKRILKMLTEINRPVERLIREIAKDSRKRQIVLREYMRGKSDQHIMKSAGITRHEFKRTLKRIFNELHESIKAEAKNIDEMRESGTVNQEIQIPGATKGTGYTPPSEMSRQDRAFFPDID